MVGKLPKLALTALIAILGATTTPTTLFSSGPFSSIEVLAQTNSHKESEADRLLQQGIQHSQSGEYKTALQSFQRAAEIYEQISDAEGLISAIIGLGIIYGARGETARAIDTFEKAIIMARENNIPQLEEIARQSLQLAQIQSNPRKAEADRLLQQGNQQHRTGQFRAALQSWEQALSIYREIGDRQGEADSLGSLGIAYLSLGQYNKAIGFFQQSLTIDREKRNRQGEAASLDSLGNAYLSLGQYNKAIEFHQQSLTIAREIEFRQGEATSLNNLGNAYLSLGQYNKAIEFNQQSLTIAREIEFREVEAASLSNLGSAYLSLGQDNKAIEFFQQSLTITREIVHRFGVGVALNNLGATYNNRQQYDKAEKVLYEAIEVRESLRIDLSDSNKVSIFETQTSSYILLQLALVAQNKTNKALEIAERGRARAFVELLASWELETSDNQLTIEAPTFKQIKQIAKDQNATLVEYSIIYNDFKVQDKKQSKESELYIWVVKPTGEITLSLDYS